MASDEEDEDVASDNSMFCFCSSNDGVVCIVLEWFLLDVDFRLKNLDAIKSNVLLDDEVDLKLLVVVEVVESFTDWECVWLDFTVFKFVFELEHGAVGVELFSGVFNVDDFLLPNKLKFF